MRISTPNVGAQFKVKNGLRKATLSEGPLKLRQIPAGSEFRTAADPTAKPSLVRISSADILTIDGQIRKTFHILIPRWHLTIGYDEYAASSGISPILPSSVRKVESSSCAPANGVATVIISPRSAPHMPLPLGIRPSPKPSSGSLRKAVPGPGPFRPRHAGQLPAAGGKRQGSSCATAR